MSINIRERFRERKFSFLYIKKKKKENDKLGILKKKKEDESIFKIILFLPLIFFGFIKNIIDHFSGENSVQRKSITLKKEEINRINNVDDNTGKKIYPRTESKQIYPVEEPRFSSLYSAKDNH